MLLRGVEGANLRGTRTSQHVFFNADEFSMRNILQHSGIAANRAIRDRNFAAHPYEPTFTRRIQLFVNFNSVSVCVGDFIFGNATFQTTVRIIRKKIFGDSL